MSKKLLDYLQLKEKGIDWSKQYIRKQEARGLFPRRVHVGPKTVKWVEDEIDDLIEQSVAERDLLGLWSVGW
jgi:predicted DNA-binding transcriptional regulator AlpA